MTATLMARTEFDARVVTENSFGLVNDYGVVHNVARLYGYDDGHYSVEWEAGDNLECVSIGIWVNPATKVVNDYDGVFSLPREIASFLKAQGFIVDPEFDTPEAEV